MDPLIDFGNGVYLVDVRDQGIPGRTGSYLLAGERLTIIETGPAPGLPHLLGAIESIGATPADVGAIIVSHIHLDHAGGAGELARRCECAKVFVHPKGARHLADPSRLIAGAKEAYGELFEGFFGEVLPVPESRIYAPGDGEVLDLGGGREVVFYHSPGHAHHHMVVYDRVTRGIFSGDSAGIRLNSLSRHIGRDYILPSSPPSAFNLREYIATLDRLAALKPEYVFFTHFGRAGDASAVFARNKTFLEAEVAVAGQIMVRGGTVKEVEEALWEMVVRELADYRIKDRCSLPEKSLALDMELNAEGIVHYLEKIQGEIS